MIFLKQYWYRFVIILMMLIALSDQPYAFYQFLRWTATISSLYLAYTAYKTKRTGWTFIFTAIGILFNPIAPFFLDKETWQIFNISVAVLYLVSLFNFKEQVQGGELGKSLTPKQERIRLSKKAKIILTLAILIPVSAFVIYEAWSVDKCFDGNNIFPIPNSKLLDGPTGKYCGCVQGYTWNNDRSACI